MSGRSQRSAADGGEFALSGVLRNPTELEAGRIRPFVSLLCLPSPHYPAARFLKRDDLRGGYIVINGHIHIV